MAKPKTIDADVRVVHGVLERARVQLSPEDHACLASVVESLIEVTRVVRETRYHDRPTSPLVRVAQQREAQGRPRQRDAGEWHRRFRATAEHRDGTGDSSSGTAERPSTTPPTPPDDDPAAADHDRDDASERDAAQPDAHPKRKGHDRIGASEYPDARRIPRRARSLSRR